MIWLIIKVQLKEEEEEEYKMKKILSGVLSQKTGVVTLEQYETFTAEKKQEYGKQNTIALLNRRFDSSSFAAFCWSGVRLGFWEWIILLSIGFFVVLLFILGLITLLKS